MKTYTVTLVYTTYAHYTIEAENEDQAEQAAWAEFDQAPPDRAYGEWETANVEELK
jgi:hypothetical protein